MNRRFRTQRIRPACPVCGKLSGCTHSARVVSYYSCPAGHTFKRSRCKTPTVRMCVLRAVHQIGTAAPADVREQLKTTGGSVKEALSALCKQQLLQRSGRGQYEITPAGAKIAQSI